MSTTKDRFEGLSRTEIIAMLVAVESELDHVERERDSIQRLHNIMLENLTATQGRCTTLIDDARALRRVLDAPPDLAKVLAEVRHERRLQDDKFGDVLARIDVPDDEGFVTHPTEWAEALVDIRESLRAHCEETVRTTCCFAHVLAEEATEALAEPDPAKRRAELVQVAAVAVLWVQVLDARKDRLESGAVV